MSIERSRVEIDLDNFAHNLQQLLQFLPPDTSFMQIVKADAYGHGAYEIAVKSLKMGAAFLGVANAEEGALLRYQNITAPILILSPSFPEEIEAILDNNLTPTVSSLDFALELDDLIAKRGANRNNVTVHIEIDTGMGRTGIHYKNAVEDIRQIRELKHLNIEGIFSHYSSSENDNSFTSLQYDRFAKIIDSLNFRVRYLHIANSAGVVTESNLSRSNNYKPITNLVRLGLLSYGIYPHSSFEQLVHLRPVMSFKSFICQIKTAYKGDCVGYNRTFTASRDVKYAIVPVGYADGYDFLLSNKGYVKIGEHLCQVIGRISMDMITVDITDFGNIQMGDEVLLLAGNELSADNVAGKYAGLSYELLSQIGRRARRYYREDGVIISQSPLARRDFVSSDFSDNKLNLIIESAISQRLQSKEIASLLYGEVLRRFFADKDRDIHYRKGFEHKVIFKLLNGVDYYEVETTLNFTKVLQQDYFYVACATKYEELEKYFRRRDVEYRWLLDANFSLNEEFFKVTRVSINDVNLNIESVIPVNAAITSKCLEIKCSHHQLKNLVGQEVSFSISTRTYYPANSHQLAIYITELTKGIKIEFHYPQEVFGKVETVPIFSGQNKYPIIRDKRTGLVEVISDPDEWIFPNSGVVFTY